MKKIINSSKRILWFKTFVVFFPCFMFLILPSCKKDELNQDSIPNMDNISPSSSDKKVKLTGKVKDVDGNWYKTVKIGEQWWMAENLKTTKYSNGDLIGTTIPSNLDITNESTPKYQWIYEDKAKNLATYGRLYTWFAVTDPRNVCPTGWHVPSDDEWKILEMFLGMTEEQADAEGSRGNNEGSKLKEIGTTHWDSPNDGATDEFGFTALPGGYRHTSLSFIWMGYGAYFCSSSETYLYGAVWSRCLFYHFITVFRNSWEPRYGCSVRCVKD
jgi:uncharacterized protein (TIGR02145 family)